MQKCSLIFEGFKSPGGKDRDERRKIKKPKEREQKDTYKDTGTHLALDRTHGGKANERDKHEQRLTETTRQRHKDCKTNRETPLELEQINRPKDKHTNTDTATRS